MPHKRQRVPSISIVSPSITLAPGGLGKHHAQGGSETPESMNSVAATSMRIASAMARISAKRPSDRRAFVTGGMTQVWPPFQFLATRPTGRIHLLSPYLVGFPGGTTARGDNAAALGFTILCIVACFAVTCLRLAGDYAVWPGRSADRDARLVDQWVANAPTDRYDQSSRGYRVGGAGSHASRSH
jgi:hypothetical protein